MSSERVEVRKLPELVADHLCEEIVSGAAAVGVVLPTEPELCSRHGVSRTVVREAVRLLAAKGLIEVRHGSGMRVRPQSDWDMLDPQVLFGRLRHERNVELLSEILEVRRIIEVSAAGLAAQRRTEQELAQLRSTLAGLDAAIDHADRFTVLDYELHEAVLAAARNRLLVDMLRPVNGVLRAARGITNRRARTLAASQHGHVEIVQAIADRDESAACDAMRRHIVQFERDIRRSFES